MSAVIFVIDLSTPPGIASAVLYFVPVLIAARVLGLVPTLLIAGGCSGLFFLGLHYSQPGADVLPILVNSALTLLAIWVTVFFFTNRKQTEVALIESAERFRSAFEQSLIPTALFNSVGNLVAINTAYGNLLGYSETELMAMDLQSLTHPDDQKIELLLYEKLVAQEMDSYVIEKRYVGKSAEIVWVAVNAAVVRDREGKPAHFIWQFHDITARKRAEETLRQSSHKFHGFLQHSPDAVLTVNGDGEIETINERLATMTGYDSSELVGQPVDLLVPGRFSGHDQLITQYFARPHIRAMGDMTELFVRQKDGTEIPVEISLTPSVADGRVVVLATIRDIVERKRVLAALRDSEQKLKSVTNAVPGAVFQFVGTKDGEFNVGFFSKGVYQLLEAEPPETAEALGPNEEFNHFLGYVVPEDIPGLYESVAAVVQDPAMWSHQFRITTPNGKTKWLSGRSTPEPPMEDGSVAFNGFLLDITERVSAERALERTRRQNQQILEAAGEGIYGVDLDGQVTFINPAAAKMIGWEREAFVGQSAHAAIHHSKPDGTQYSKDQCPIYEAITRGEIRHIADEVYWRKDGTSFPVDYVTTPIIEHGEVDGAVVVFRDVTEARRLSDQLLYQATRDGLTGLVNRQDFEQQLGDFLDLAETSDAENALAYLDLDQFKLINDTCGHVAGDELLRQLALMIPLRLRKGDILARLGGDEFGILMKNCSMQDARMVMNRVREEIAAFRFVWEGKSFNIGASIGLVPVTGSSMDSSEALKRADAACYAAKDAGRNRLHVYLDDDEELARRQGEMQWVSQISEAMENGRFQLYAQPIVATADGGVREARYEFLLRMQDDAEEIISASAFLPAAERYNLSSTLDRWVVKTAFEWLALHQQELSAVACWSINLSGLSLGDEDTLSFIIQKLNNVDVPAEKICFEITETAAITNLAHASQFISSLKEHGCKFALDDFGSGLSSFAYLKNLEVDYLKIDGVFVKGICDDPIDLAMVKSINDIGHILGKKTIAEFVENDAILQKLREIKVDYAQGYGIGRPQPLDELLAYAIAS